MIAIAIKSIRFYFLSLLTSMAATLTLRYKRAVKQAALFNKSKQYLNNLDISIALAYSKGIPIEEIAKQFNIHKRSVYRRIHKVKTHTGCYTKITLKKYLQNWMTI